MFLQSPLLSINKTDNQTQLLLSELQQGQPKVTSQKVNPGPHVDGRDPKHLMPHGLPPPGAP